MKTVFYILAVVLLLAGVAIAGLLLLGSQFSFTCGHELLERETSPDGVVDAVVLRRDCGATTSDSYSVYIVNRGLEPDTSTEFDNDEKGPVFLADGLHEIDLVWHAADELEIVYDRARIFHFTSYWEDVIVNNFAHRISIIETPKTRNMENRGPAQ